MAMMNYLMDQMDDITGLGGLFRSPRIKLPPPTPIVASRGPMTFHNINVQGSVVGAINTGQVQQIDVAIDHIKLGGDTDLAQSLAQFTEALLADTALKENDKKEILYCLFLRHRGCPNRAAKTGDNPIGDAGDCQGG